MLLDEDFTLKTMCMCACSLAELCLTLKPLGLYPTRLLYPRDLLEKNKRGGCHFLLQEFSLTQGLNLHLLHWQADSVPLPCLGSPHLHKGCFQIQLTFNNIGLNYEGSLTCGNFSVVSSTVLHSVWLVEPVDAGP